MEVFNMIFAAFKAMGYGLLEFMTSPLLPGEVVTFFDEINDLIGADEILTLLGIDSWSVITPLWMIGAGIGCVLVYNLVSWLIDILP